jgi:hypothetical protein
MIMAAVRKRNAAVGDMAVHRRPATVLAARLAPANFARTLPVTLSSVRGVTSAEGPGRPSRQEQSNGLARRDAANTAGTHEVTLRCVVIGDSRGTHEGG